jgi:hypothetical protein
MTEHYALIKPLRICRIVLNGCWRVSTTLYLLLILVSFSAVCHANDVDIQLTTNDGSTKMSVNNSGANSIASIDSQGDAIFNKAVTISSNAVLSGATFYSAGTINISNPTTHTGTLTVINSATLGAAGNTVTISSNAVLPGTTIYQNGNVQMGVGSVLMGSGGNTVTISSNAILSGATFYQNAPTVINKLYTGMTLGNTANTSIAAGAGMGTLGANLGISILAGGTNTYGVITSTTGTTSGGTNATFATITPSIAAPHQIVCVLSPANNNAANLANTIQPKIVGTSTTWLIVTSGTQFPGSATNYMWNYICGGY